MHQALADVTELEMDAVQVQGIALCRTTLLDKTCLLEEENKKVGIENGMLYII